jgi:hypothetical protein
MAQRERELGLPPAALARWTDGVDRRRQLARALHAEPAPRTRRITERLEQLRVQLAAYRAGAIAIHKKLLELEAIGSHDAAILRVRLIEISVRIELIVRGIID